MFQDFVKNQGAPVKKPGDTRRMKRGQFETLATWVVKS